MARRYAMDIIVFFSAAVVMSLEIVGSRILSPYMGSSLMVWTALIGIILAALAAGSFWGGRIADRKEMPGFLSVIFVSTAVFIIILSWVKDPILTSITASFADLRVAATVGAIVTLAVPSFLLGSVLPYVTRRTFLDKRFLGNHVGRLYALSTAGSILGTFATGFYLLSYLGNGGILRLLAGVLLLLAFMSSLLKKRPTLILLSLSLIATLPLMPPPQGIPALVDRDTRYGRVVIADAAHGKTGETLRTMYIDRSPMSRMALNNDDLQSDVYKFFRLGDHFNPAISHALMLGGAGYSYPKDFLRTHPQATLDVVEIDPEVTRLAHEYFALTDDPRLKIFHEDARLFLNNNTNLYDAVYADVYNPSGAIPYHTTTLGAVTRIYNALSNDGVVIINIASPVEGKYAAFVRSQYATYKRIFPTVLLFPIPDEQNPSEARHVMLVALKNPAAPILTSQNQESARLLSFMYRKEIPPGRILTDDYAPVDQMMYGFAN